MRFGRSRSTGMAAAVLAVLVAVVAPVTLTGASAGAAGAGFNVHTWTDPKGDQHLVRWNPCQSITYAVNVRLAGHSERARHRAVADVRSAFHRAAQRTGLKFSFSGRTSELPRNSGDTSWSTRQKAAEIVVAWVDPEKPKFRSNLLTDTGTGYPSGVGGWMLRGWQDSKGHWRAAVGRGFVVINADQNNRYQPGFGAGVTRGALLLHELGHALGLGHVGTTSELMYPTMLNRQHSNYKTGDSQGLVKVGRRLGCIAGADLVWPQI